MADRAALIEPVRIGIIGCGMVSELYLAVLSRIALVDVIGCADLIAERARRISQRFGVERAMSVDDLLTDPAIELVVNITPPRQHAELTFAALNAGKSVYSEKPLALDSAEGSRLVVAAARKGLVLGCAPDTVLSAALQSSRGALAGGLLGHPFAASSADYSAGHERWHPNAACFYERGGGPVLDLGPYSLTWLVNLFGPVAKVYGVGTIGHAKRVLREGAEIEAETWTHVSAIVEFQIGIALTLGLSFDVAASAHPALEIYGSAGTLSLPDPSAGQGTASFYRWADAKRRKVAVTAGLVGEVGKGMGLVDVACAIRFNSPVRVSAEVALHVLDVMNGILTSAAEGRPVPVATSCQIPPPIPVIAVSELAGADYSWVERYIGPD